MLTEPKITQHKEQVGQKNKEVGGRICIDDCVGGNPRGRLNCTVLSHLLFSSPLLQLPLLLFSLGTRTRKRHEAAYY